MCDYTTGTGQDHCNHWPEVRNAPRHAEYCRDDGKVGIKCPRCDDRFLSPEVAFWHLSTQHVRKMRRSFEEVRE